MPSVSGAGVHLRVQCEGEWPGGKSTSRTPDAKEREESSRDRDEVEEVATVEKRVMAVLLGTQ